jgi:hypothetical protein
MIFAIDPGTTQSAAVEWNGEKIGFCKIVENEELLQYCKAAWGCPHFNENNRVVVEMVASYGMPVGREVFETVLFVGRLMEVGMANGCDFKLIYRQAVKLNLCHSARANDSNIRQALIDRFGAPGTKKAPGLTRPLTRDLWQAFALAVTAFDTLPPMITPARPSGLGHQP